MTTIENLAGVPSVAELTALANQLFPDLTGSIAEPEAPEVPEQTIYGGSQDIILPYANAPEIPAIPEVSAIPEVPTATPATSGYAPQVLSQSQADEASRSIDVPTSLGGDQVKK